MYIAVLTLMILEVSSEWVEISQQHYRTPINSQIREPIEKYIDENIYSNQSIANFNWKNSVHQKQSIHNIKLLKHRTSNSYETSTGRTFTIETVDTSEASDEFGFTEEIPFINRDYGVIEKVSNAGSVQRVQLSKSPIRSPISKYSEASIKSNPHRFHKVQKTVNPYEYRDNSDFESDLIQDTGKAVQSITDKVEGISEHRIVLTKPKTQSNMAETTLDTFKSTLVPMTTNFRNQYSTSYFKNKQQDKNIFGTAKDIHKESIIDFSHKIQENRDTTLPPLDMANEFMRYKEESLKLNNSNIRKERPKSKFSSNPKDPKSNNTQTKVSENGKQDNAMENVMKFIKVVADTISKNTRKTVGSKTRYLQELKETILANIEDRIDSTWPDDENIGDRRQSRSTDATARGHVEFPSSESSLMTISFLTFAVFLIKLVLQIIQTYKNKAMMVAPVVVATAGRALKKMQSAENLDNSNT